MQCYPVPLHHAQVKNMNEERDEVSVELEDDRGKEIVRVRQWLLLNSTGNSLSGSCDRAVTGATV